MATIHNHRRIPSSLRWVAVLFVLYGLISVIEILASFANDHISINFGVLCLFAGPGLLALRNGWRKFSLFVLWITMIAAFLLVLYLLGNQGPFEVQRYGEPFGEVPEVVGWVLAIGVFLLSFVQYRILMLPRICILFGVEPTNKSSNTDASDAGAG